MRATIQNSIAIGTDLADVILRNQYVPGSQVSVYESLCREIVHPKSHMLTEA